MPRSANLFRFGALALALATAACARSDAGPVKQNAAASGGDVAAKPAGNAMAGGPTDSISTRADRGRIRGAESAPIWLIEISDFQCPYCKQWHDETFAVLDREYVQTGKVRLAYLNFPIPSLHPNARSAAEAAMCASVQDKFWPLHESLFNSQAAWAKLPDPMAFFDSLATAALVEPKAWKSCMSTHATVPLIDADHDKSKSSGVESTPTFFIGQTMFKGAYPADSFRVVIEKEIAKAKGGR